MWSNLEVGSLPVILFVRRHLETVKVTDVSKWGVIVNQVNPDDVATAAPPSPVADVRYRRRGRPIRRAQDSVAKLVLQALSARILTVW